MATFTSRPNLVTGSTDWVFVDDDQFDYQQELARSAFADMLHDHERNVQYEKAIRKTLDQLAKTSEKIHLLDIGTGTGLLSMLAARAWKEGSRPSSSSFRITACEVFQPMAKIAKKCIEKNGLSETIRVIDKRSTELDLTKDFQGDRINAIVAEVFDTELIGEGAFRTFFEACRHLTVDRPNLRIVPARATIYIQLVQSKLLDEFHRLKDLRPSSNRLKIPDDCRHLAGNSIFDLNLNEIPEEIQPLTEPIAVFHFDFKNLDASKNFVQEKIVERVRCERRGQIDAVIMWWNLDMDEDGEIQLGTTPIWCLDPSAKKEVQWREHWIHAIYYPQERRTVEANEQISLYCFHDEYSLYFDVGPEPFRPRSYPPSVLSRSAISAFNCDQRRDKFLRALEKTFAHSSPSRCLYIGDGLLLPFLLLDRYPQCELLLLQSTNSHLTRTIGAILSNSAADLKYRFVPSLDHPSLDYSSIDAIVAEPFFTKSILPWDNLHLYYLLRQCPSNRCRVFPRQVRFRCIALEFEHLHKIRSPVDHCLGFDLTPFDDQIIQASLQVDAPIEPQPLFEYSSKRPRLSSIVDLFHLDLQQKDPAEPVKKTVDIPIEHDGICNGLAFWIDYELAEGIWLTTGIDNANDAWVTYSKQGVHLLVKPVNVQRGMNLAIDVGFDFQQGQFLFQWTSKQKI